MEFFFCKTIGLPHLEVPRLSPAAVQQWPSATGDTVNPSKDIQYSQGATFTLLSGNTLHTIRPVFKYSQSHMVTRLLDQLQNFLVSYMDGFIFPQSVMSPVLVYHGNKLSLRDQRQEETSCSAVHSACGTAAEEPQETQSSHTEQQSQSGRFNCL